jgi:hypothetical protein
MENGPVPLVWGFRRARLTSPPEPKTRAPHPKPNPNPNPNPNPDPDPNPNPNPDPNTSPSPSPSPSPNPKQARRARPLPPAFVLMYHCDNVVPQQAQSGQCPNAPMPQCPMPNAQCPMPNAQCPTPGVVEAPPWQCPSSAPALPLLCPCAASGPRGSRDGPRGSGRARRARHSHGESPARWAPSCCLELLPRVPAPVGSDAASRFHPPTLWAQP